MPAPVNVTVDVGVSVRWRLSLLLLFALALAVRVPLVLSHPAVFGGDSVVRLARSNELLLGYWLPLPQALVFLARAVHPDPLWARLLFAVIGALVPVALARVVASLHGADAGACAGALLAAHPLWAYYSLVPYQEGVTALFLLLGAGALARGRERAAALWLGFACLCRYEAWLAAGLAAATRWRRPRAAALFALVPALWMLLNLGLGPRGSYVLDLDPAAARLARLAFLLVKLRQYSGDVFLLLAALGIALAVRRWDRRWAWGALFVLAVVAATAVAGHEWPPGSGQVSERMAHLPVAGLCAGAGLALGALAEAPRGRMRLAGAAAAAAALAFLCWRWTGQLRAQVREANADPSLRLAVDVASFASGRLSPGGRLAVAGAPIPEEAVQAYVRKVAAGHGDVERARAIALQWSGHSADLDRVAANLARPPGTAIRAGTGPAELLAVFDDAPQPPACGQALARFTAGARGATVCLPPR